MHSEDYYKSMLDTENNNLNARLGWLLTTETLLFTAIAFSWDKPVLVTIIICLLGITTSFSYRIYLICNIKAFEKIEELARQEGANFILGISKSDIPPWYHYFMPWNILPMSFMLAWIILLLYKLTVFLPDHDFINLIQT